MSTQEVARFLGAVGIGTGALVWLLRSLFVHMLSRDVEQFKARLQAQHTLEIERFRNDLNLAAFERQTRFARLHEDRAEIIEELYRKLHKADAAFEALVSPLKVLGADGMRGLIDAAGKFGQDFFDYFNENRIYLDADLCGQIDALNREFRRTWADFVPFGDEANVAKGIEHLKVWTDFKEKVPPLRKEIENRFRKLLGVELD